jgi:hypothetical protein
MKKAKYFLIPVLVTLVVLVISLYPTANISKRASAAPRAAVVTKYLMIPAAAFNPTEGGYDFHNFGRIVESIDGFTSFIAPVYLPSGARIRLIKLYAKDTNTTNEVCANLREFQPKSGTDSLVKKVCTSGSSGHQQPARYVSRYIKWYYGYYIFLNYPTPYGLSTYAVLLKYTINQ